MTANILTTDQCQNSGQAIGSLVRNCRDAYLRAANLLEFHSEDIGRLRNLEAMETAELTALAPAYFALCDRYRTALYNPQIGLFPSDQRTPEEIWWAWFYHELTPQLLGNVHFIRSVLRSVGLLSCADMNKAKVEVESILEQQDLLPTYHYATWPAPL